jgi:hypothetical protein
MKAKQKTLIQLEEEENPCNEELEPFRLEGKIVPIEADRIIVKKGEIIIMQQDGFTTHKPAKFEIVEGFKQEGNEEDAGYALRFKGSRGLWKELKKDLGAGLQKIVDRRKIKEERCKHLKI